MQRSRCDVVTDVTCLSVMAVTVNMIPGDINCRSPGDATFSRCFATKKFNMIPIKSTLCLVSLNHGEAEKIIYYISKKFDKEHCLKLDNQKRLIKTTLQTKDAQFVAQGRNINGFFLEKKDNHIPISNSVCSAGYDHKCGSITRWISPSRSSSLVQSTVNEVGNSTVHRARPSRTLVPTGTWKSTISRSSVTACRAPVDRFDHSPSSSWESEEISWARLYRLCRWRLCRGECGWRASRTARTRTCVMFGQCRVTSPRPCRLSSSVQVKSNGSRAVAVPAAVVELLNVIPRKWGGERAGIARCFDRWVNTLGWGAAAAASRKAAAGNPQTSFSPC